MMDGRTIVERFLHAFESGDGNVLRRTLNKDFVFAHEASPPAVDRPGYLLLAERIHEAIPDWRFRHERLTDEDGTVTGRLRITGTHTGRLDLSEFGISPLRPTHARVSLPVEYGAWTIDGATIERFEVRNPEGAGGLRGVLAQLGVTVPARTAAM